MKDQNIYFYLPGLVSFARLNLMMIDFIKHYPDKCLDNVKIGAVYGCFPSALWNGGRLFVGDRTSETGMRNLVEEYNSRGIPVRYTWTNTMLEDKHFADEYCIQAMEIANNGLNEVIVNSEKLEDMIRDKYPNYSIISSTTKCILDVDGLNQELDKDYKLVVLDYRKNHDLEFLSQVNDLSRIEMLINAWCSPDCPTRKEHYDFLSQETINGSQHARFNCVYKANNFYEAFRNHTVLRAGEIPIYKEIGIQHFKLEGRGYLVPNIIESYVCYLIKPEFQNEVRLMLLNELFAVNYLKDPNYL